MCYFLFVYLIKEVICKVKVIIPKIEDIVYGTGIGTSKKEAEQEAAKNALEKLAVKN